MVVKKKDKVRSKGKPNEVIREVVRTEMLNVVTEVIIPAFDQVYSAIEDLKIETHNNFADVNRRLTDLSMDTPSRKEFNEHGQRIQKLEHELGFV
jgi:hypothetical protein